MSKTELAPGHVLVQGPRGRHISVHQSTQEALPEIFPLAKKAAPATKKSAPAVKKSAPAAETPATAVVKTVDELKEPSNGD